MAIIGAYLFFWSQEIVQKAGFRGCVIEFKPNRNLECAYVNLHYENPLRAAGGKDVSSTSLNKSELRQTPDGFLKYYLRQPGSDADVAYKFAPTLHLHSVFGWVCCFALSVHSRGAGTGRAAQGLETIFRSSLFDR